MARQVWKFEETGRWVRTYLNGEVVADSKNGMLLIESRGELDYYFPLETVKMDYLEPSDHVETSGYRGTRKFWHVRVGDKVAENAAWTYAPKKNRPDVSNFVAFKWSLMDRWFEEDEEQFLHPRHPYHRVDTVPSTRHVEVLVNGVKVADSKRPFLLFETTLPTRYYIPEEDVDMSLLTPTEASSVCPYKGKASYYSVEAGGDSFDNIVWTYPDPIPEAPKLKGTLAFWPEKDKRIQIVVDGEPV